MNDHEAAVRAVGGELAAAILAALRADVQPHPHVRDRLLGIAEAAGELGVGRTTVYQLISAGRLRSLKVGRRRLIPSSAIAEYIALNA